MRRSIYFSWLIAVPILMVLLASQHQSSVRATTNPQIPPRPEVPGSAPIPLDCGTGWNIVSSPSPGGGENILSAAAAVTSSDVWAVGDTAGVPNGPQAALIEHWDGVQWSTVITPNIGASDLYGISARTATDIWTVGAGMTGTLTLHWNGIQWGYVPSPNGPNPDNALKAVSALGADDVWAVGDSYNGSLPDQTLIEHWNGSAWTVVPSPNPGTFENLLHTVVAIAPNDVWAAGVTSNNASIFQTLIEHWNGGVWTVVPSPSPGSVDTLWGLAATGPTAVWAVGSTGDQYGGANTLVLRWDGSTWSRIPSPSPAADFSVLHAIAASGPNDIWTAGYQNNGDGDITLTEHWDGTQWTLVPSPNNGSQGSYFLGVAAPGDNEGWAFGYYFAGNGLRPTLVEHYTTPCVTASPTVPGGSTPTATPTVPPVTASPTAPGGSTPTPTSTVCAVNFSDVHPTDYFAAPVQYLACHGVISGYGDGTFRPYSNTTRAQQAKIVVLGFAYPIRTPSAGAYTFADVPPTQPFYSFVETAAASGIVSGYTCGAPQEPCDDRHRPYFRPNMEVTRGQLSKIDVLAASWPLQTPASPTFSDVAPGSPFYAYIETAVCHGIISGYADHSFRPGATATRGQIAKIVYLSLTAGSTCAPTMSR